jgi:hypothetical protein
MSLLPGQILPPDIPIGQADLDTGAVVVNHDWWLLLYNLCNQVLGPGLPASALQAIEATDLDVVTADIPSIVRQIANLQQLFPEQEVVPALREITNAVMIALAQFEENLPFNGYATPTAKVGLTPVAGSAATAMHSDAAPPLDQGISPTWTGAHTFAQPAEELVLNSTTATNAVIVMFQLASANKTRVGAEGTAGATITGSSAGDLVLFSSTGLSMSANGGGLAMRIDSSGTIDFHSVATTTSAPSSGGGGALPATPAGYATLSIGGTPRKIAYY